MKVEKVSATIRYSQDTGKGAWKVIELGAEGTVDTRETWQGAQAYLYAELGKQMKGLWANGHQLQENASVATEVNGDKPKGQEPSQTTPEHYCQEHQVEYQQHVKGNQVWYSHKTPDGEWCREPVA